MFWTKLSDVKVAMGEVFFGFRCYKRPHLQASDVFKRSSFGGDRCNQEPFSHMLEPSLRVKWRGNMVDD